MCNKKTIFSIFVYDESIKFCDRHQMQVQFNFILISLQKVESLLTTILLITYIPSLQIGSAGEDKFFFQFLQ